VLLQLLNETFVQVVLMLLLLLLLLLLRLM